MAWAERPDHDRFVKGWQNHALVQGLGWQHTDAWPHGVLRSRWQDAKGDAPLPNAQIGEVFYRLLFRGGTYFNIKEATAHWFAPDIPPMTYGDWTGNAWYSTERPHPAGGTFTGYFGPSQLGFGRAWFEQYATDQAAMGFTAILIAAEEHYFSNPALPPRWGKNLNIYASVQDRETFLWALAFARSVGLRPIPVLTDRVGTLARTIDGLVELGHYLGRLCRGQVTAYQLPWETDEPWGVHIPWNGWTDKLYEVHEARIAEAIHAEDPDATIGVQHADGHRFSHGFAQRCKDLHIANFMQLSRAATTPALEASTAMMAERAAQDGVGFCIFEHSAPEHLTEMSYAECQQRHAACLRGAAPFVSAIPRFGWLNG